MNPVFSNNLKKERHVKCWSQIKAAAVLDIPIKRFAAWEEGRSEPNIKDLAQLIRIYQVKHVVAFLSDEDYEPGLKYSVNSVLDECYGRLSEKEKQTVNQVLGI